jgi:hypothetical protein
MSFFNRYVANLKSINKEIQAVTDRFVSDPEGTRENLEELIRVGRAAYIAGRTLKFKRIPHRPTSFEQGMEWIKDAADYLTALEKFVRKDVIPVVDQVLLLASGNRDIITALNEVEDNATDPSTLTMVERARGYVMSIQELGLDREEFEDLKILNEPYEAVSNMNMASIESVLSEGVRSLEVLGPYNKLAPNGKSYVMSQTPWILYHNSEGWRNESVVQSTPTGDVGAGALAHTATSYRNACRFVEEDTTGYLAVPPKSSNYKWFAVASVYTRLFNDKGTGVQGDLAASGKDLVSVRAWTGLTPGGATISAALEAIRINSGLTVDGDEIIESSVEIAVEIKPTATVGTSEYVHYDVVFGNVDTAGVVGLTLQAFEVNNVRLIGYPKEREVDFSDITYRNADGVFAIKKDDRFIDYFGKIADEPTDDPNYSVEALYRERLGNGATILGQMIQVLKIYSETYHKSGDRVDDKYNRLGCTNGITDMLAVQRWLERTSAPFGETLPASTTDKDEITLLFSTLLQDLKYLRDHARLDKNVLKTVSSAMSFTTSSNVSF